MRLALLAAVLLALGSAEAAGAQLGALRPCPQEPAFRCGTLRVPLDHRGRTPGTLRLRVAVQRGARPRGRLTVALSGGPGQPGVPFAGAFASTLEPLVQAGERLVVLDQRGTGAGALRCDGLQRLGGLADYLPASVAACAAAIGPRRAFFTTQDTVADLEVLRRALRAPALGLFGVSYGTHVALQYARTHPTRTRRLVLDSVLGPEGWDGLFLPVYGAIPRVLREVCRGRRCARATADPVADVAAVAPRAATQGLGATVVDVAGRPRALAARLRGALPFLVVAADLSPELMALLPSAFAAAAAGDDAPLLRLLPLLEGARTSSRELSAGLLMATDCADARLPYTLEQPLAERPPLVAAALAAADPARFAPFPRAAIEENALAVDCLRWPVQPAKPPSTAPLPDVPTLVLSGRHDVRTPLEQARSVAELLPRATLVAVPGVGHDVLGADRTGCARRALERWATGRRVGRPCSRRSSAVPVAPRPSLRTPSGRRAVAQAAADTADDALRLVFARGEAGLTGRTGCLRAGRARATGDGARLLGCSWAPGVRVSGTVREDGEASLRVDGPGRADGRVRVEGGDVTGRLGGRAVRITRSSRTAAAPPAPAPRTPRGPLAPGRAGAPSPPPRTPAR